MTASTILFSRSILYLARRPISILLWKVAVRFRVSGNFLPTFQEIFMEILFLNVIFADAAFLKAIKLQSNGEDPFPPWDALETHFEDYSDQLWRENPSLSG